MHASSGKLAQLRRGLLELAVLSVISSGKVYSADILSALAKTDFATGEGTLYPLLSRLRREKLIDYEWSESEVGPPRKYYSLAEEGRAALDGQLDYWTRIYATINKLGAEHA